MFEITMLALADGASGLVSLYWICLIVGMGLILISTLLGSHGHGDVDAHFDADFGVDADVGIDIHADADVSLDTDVGMDVGADVDVPGHVDAPGDIGGHHHVDHAGASLTSWFSIQFVVYFMAVFGAVGVIFTYLSDGMSSVLVLGLAAGGGLLVGQGVHQLLRSIRRSSGNSALQPTDYVNKLARVTVAIRPGKTGEIAVKAKRAERFIPAIAKRDGGEFGAGEIVAVVGYTAGLGEVVSRKEFEFLHDTDEGGQA